MTGPVAVSGAAAGLLAAVLASIGYGLASVLQAVGARRAAASGAGTAVQPAHLGGLALDGASWLVSLLALRVLPLFAVQAVLAGSLAVTAVAGERALQLRLVPEPGRRSRAVRNRVSMWSRSGR